MALTIEMIEDKEFKIGLRGYDQKDVDSFLDEVCDQIEAMENEIASLKAKLSRAGQAPAMTAAPAIIPAPMAVQSVPVPAPMAVQPAPVPAPVPQPIPALPQEEAPAQEDASEAAQRLLASAQKVYDDTVAEANAEAKRILREAQSGADAEINGLTSERDALKAEIEMLKDTARDYRERFRHLLLDQQHVLDSEKALFE